MWASRRAPTSGSSPASAAVAAAGAIRPRRSAAVCSGSRQRTAADVGRRLAAQDPGRLGGVGLGEPADQPIGEGHDSSPVSSTEISSPKSLAGTATRPSAASSTTAIGVILTIRPSKPAIFTRWPTSYSRCRW